MNRDFKKPSLSLVLSSRRLHGRLMLAVLSTAALMLGVTGTAEASDSWCPSNSTTSWTGGNGVWAQGNWSNSQPTGGCDAVISGDVTVTLTTSPDPDGGYTDSGGSAKGLTIENGATLIVEGVGSDSLGNWYNATTLGLGDDGITIGPGSTLVLEASDNNDITPSPGEASGGSANVVATNAQAAPFVNQGTIIAETSDPTYDTSMTFGGTLTNSGTIDVQSGTLDFSGASPYMTATNSGAINVSSGTTFDMQAGDGSSFTNTGTINNAGTTWAGSSMDWDAGGTVTGNPVYLEDYNRGVPTLVEPASGSANGTYIFTNGGFLTGNIPAGQTLEAQGTGGNDSGINLNNATINNSGTLLLDAPGTGTNSGGSAILFSGTINNYGTLKTSVEDSSYDTEMQSTLNNEPGGTVEELSGTLYQENGDTSTNSGLWQIAPGAVYEMYGGGFTNNANGTLQPQISAAGTYGVVNLRNGTFTAGGTIAPELVSGYAPAAGTEFQIFPYNGGSFSGTFASTSNSFSTDYSHQSVPNGTSYVGVVYNAVPAAAGGTSSGSATVKPSAGSIKGGAAEVMVKLACPSGKTCSSYEVTGKVTEHLKRGKVTAVSARAGEKKAKKQVTTKVVTIASASGSVGDGKSKAVTLRLNKAGEALLKRFKKLKVSVTVTAGGKTVKTETVTVTEPKSKKKK